MLNIGLLRTRCPRRRDMVLGALMKGESKRWITMSRPYGPGSAMRLWPSMPSGPRTATISLHPWTSRCGCKTSLALSTCTLIVRRSLMCSRRFPEVDQHTSCKFGLQQPFSIFLSFITPLLLGQLPYQQ